MTFRIFRTKTIMYGLIFIFIGPIIATGMFLWFPFITLLNYIIAIFLLGGFFYLLYTYTMWRIIVTESGLEYRISFKRGHKSWEDIEFIGVDWYPRKQKEVIPFDIYQIHSVPLIYFLGHSDSTSYEDGAIHKAFLKVHYRKEIIEEILKYYTGNITDIHLVDI